MAVKKSTVPSPKEVKTSTKSFTSEEISSINQLRQAIETATYQFGQIKINQIKLDEQEDILKKQLSSLENQEKELARQLTSKYGKGSIDLDTGTFTPTE